MKKLFGMIVVVAAAMAALGSAAEVGSGRTLVGTVVDRQTGQPLDGASVVLERLGQSRWRVAATTDSNGEFSFSGLAEGWFRLDTTARGLQPMREGIAIGSGGGEIRVRIELRGAAERDPSRPELILSGAQDVRLLSDAELARFVAGTDAPVRPGPVDLKEEDRAAVGEGSWAPGGSRDRADGFEQEAGEPAPAVLDATRKSVAGRHYALSPLASADADTRNTVESLMTGDPDEVWIIERPGARRPTDPDQDPGTGCLVVVQEGREVAVPLEHTEVRARIDGYVASVEVEQRFHNPFPATIEVEYIFPLPHDAAVNDFLMTVGDRKIRGIIREKEEAREIYERARDAGFVASLLEQERPNIFRQRVANIEPGHRIEVELHYFNRLPYRDGAFEFAFPLVVGPRFNPPHSDDPIGAVPRGTQTTGTAVSYLAPGERSGHDVNISVDLDAGLAVESLKSLNHVTRIDRDGKSRAHIELAATDRIPNKDFVLRYQVASDKVKSEILTHLEGDGGYFTMMLVPPAELAGMQRAPVEFVFVLDCSGSMNGWPMEKSKSAMRRALRQLQPGDSFQVIRFSEGASALGPVPVEATTANIERGLAYVDGLHGSGGTMMIEGIKAALDFPHDPGRSRVVTFMTDGYIGNEAEIFAEIAARLGPTKIFSFGVGQSVNRHLIEGMARMGQGAVAYIGLDDDLGAVDEFYRIVRHPALTDIEIDFGGMRARQLFPQRLGDLFVGRPVMVHGRFDGQEGYRHRPRSRGRAGGLDEDPRGSCRPDRARSPAAALGPQ